MLIAPLFRGKSPSWTNSIVVSGTVFCLASVIALNYSFLRLYHDHYSIMFVPYAVISFTYLCILAASHKDDLRTVQLIMSGAIKLGLAAWYFVIAGTQVWALSSETQLELNFSINERNIDPELIKFLEQVLSNDMSFYVADNTNYHRLQHQAQNRRWPPRNVA